IAHHPIGHQTEPERRSDGGGSDRGTPPRPRTIAAELADELIHGRKSLAGFHGQAAQHDRAERAGDVRAGRGGLDATLAYVVREVVDGGALERTLAIERFVERDAEVEL